MIPQPGEYVRCLSDDAVIGHLTVGKVYLVEEAPLSNYWVYVQRDDCPGYGGYNPDRFEVCHPVYSYEYSDKSTSPKEI